MTAEKTRQEKFRQLRIQAETLLAAKERDAQPDIQGDPLKLFHELQTLQLELEMQNEELRVSQKELIESRERAIELYDSAPVGYLTISKKKVIQRANLTFAGMVSVERKALENTPLSAYILPRDQDIFHLHLTSLSDSSPRQVCELGMQRKDGTTFDVQLETVYIPGGGKNERYHVIVIDISLRKKIEREKKILEAKLQQADKMEALGNLVSGIAHDFNNLLSMIIGSTELALHDTPERHPVHTYLEYIHEAGFKASGIVRQLLSFSRKQAPEPKTVDAVKLVKETLKFLRSMIPSTIDIRGHLPDQEISIHADTVQINQVLINICINAGQAMEGSGGILDIALKQVKLTQKSARAYPDLSPGRYIKIMITDTGPGISSTIINKIFDPYFTTKEIKKGLGMGLAVVHGIVKNHSGAISAENRPGKGAVFTLFFPVVDEKIEPEVETEDDLPQGTESILFIDDEPTITKIAGETLKKLGYTAEISQDPLEALNLFKSDPEQFDLVITDMTMPQMTGIKLSENIRNIRRDIPIIICTGYSAIDKGVPRGLEISAYLVKPITMPKIAKIIRKVLDD